MDGVGIPLTLTTKEDFVEPEVLVASTIYSPASSAMAPEKYQWRCRQVPFNHINYTVSFANGRINNKYALVK